MLYNITYTGDLKEPNAQKQTRIVVAAASGWEKLGDIDQKVQDEEVLSI